ncbi:MAG: hypothetical protein HQK54_00785 [Oligoflexales bacterium]|nr:hypothetical protein [Oligoflexales bacterium]
MSKEDAFLHHENNRPFFSKGFFSSIKNVNTFQVILLCLTFFAMHFMLLINRGVYWDGHITLRFIKNGDFNSIWWISSQMGRYDGSFIVAFIASFPDPILAFKIITFVSILSGALAIFYALKNLFKFDIFTAYLGFCLFSTLPLYNLTPELCLVSSHINIGLFLVGNLCAGYYFSKDSSYPYLLLSALCLFISFATTSLIVLEFPVIVLISICVYKKRSKLISFMLFCSIPAIRFLLREKPTGIYYDYNRINLKASEIVMYMQNTIKAILSYSFHFIRIRITDSDFYLSSAIGIFGILVLLFGLRFFYKNRNRKESLLSRKYSVFLIMISVVSAFCAIFPYVVVDKAPYPYDFHIRHSLPLGCVVPFFFIAVRSLFYSFLKSNFLQKVIDTCMSVAVIVFLITCTWSYIQWDYDWYKQLALRNTLKSKYEPLDNCDVALFKDLSGFRNQNDRIYRFYDWASILIEAINSERILVAAERDEFQGKMDMLYKSNKNQRNAFLKYLLASDYTGGERYCTVSIYSLRPHTPGLTDYLTLKYSELFDHQKFDRLVNGWFTANIARSSELPFRVKS